MARPPKTNRLSLNQISKHLGNPLLFSYEGRALIDAFLPPWGDEYDHLFGNASSESNIAFFCSGNRKEGSRLANPLSISAIVLKLQSDQKFISDALERTQQWSQGTPKLTRNNAIFDLVLQSKEKPTAKENAEFFRIEEMLEKLKECGTADSMRYALFLLVMIGVLQERIIAVPHLYDLGRSSEVNPYLRKALDTKKQENPAEAIHAKTVNSEPERQWIPPLSGVAFIQEAIDHFSKKEMKIRSIDMAFHSGSHWLSDIENMRLLHRINERKIPVRVLVNTEAAAQGLRDHLQDSGTIDVGFEKSIEGWKQRAQDSSGHMKVRVSNIPLIHRTYLVRTKSGSGFANITFYTYGTDIDKQNYRCCFQGGTSEYKIFADEFDYLWQQAGKDLE